MEIPLNRLLCSNCKAFHTIQDFPFESRGYRVATRTVSGEGHLKGKIPPPKEASMRIRLSIYTDTPIQINS